MSSGTAIAAISEHEPSGSSDALLCVIEARRLLEHAKSLHNVKKIRDKMSAIKSYLRQRDESLEAQNAAAEIKIRAERRAGELLAEMPERRGQHEKLHDETFQPAPTLADLGLTKTQSHRWQQIASLPEEDFEFHIEDTRSSGKELTTSGVLKVAARQTIVVPEPDWDTEAGGDITDSLPSLIDAGRKFRTIYADPPWQYGNQATRASTDNHYGTMTVPEICAEPVAQLAEDDAHLHLWTTNAFLFDARDVMAAWGFTYKSCFVWVKPQIGMGNYWRVSHEFLLFGVRGKQPFRARDERSWAELDRGEHSEKPDAFRQKVEKVSPGPYLEMYGRISIPQSAWTTYGNQVSKRLF